MDWKEETSPGPICLRRALGLARNARSQRGFSLAELLFVVIIIGLLATVLTPSKGSGDSAKLDLATMEVADAMRFARSEAMRLGIEHGVRQQSVEKRVRVVSMNMATNPATLVFDKYHPIDKQIYDRDLNGQPFDFSGSINQAPVFRGGCDSPEDIYFDAGGTPWCADPDDILVDNVVITLSLDGKTRSVILHGINGRVTVQ
jgi:prepilin-type N-terminal cleavage/methylation domain-containing protein